MHIILAHENADFDAVAALAAAHKLTPDALPVLPQRLNRNVNQFVTLYQNGLPFRQADDIDLKRVTAVTLVDTQRIPGFKGLPGDVSLTIIDHHPRDPALDPDVAFSGTTIGATTTLLVEQIEHKGLPLSAVEATLLALGIYEDTGSLSYGKTTPRDVRAAAWLIEQGASLDSVRRFLEPPFTDEQQTLFEILIDRSDTRTLQGYSVTVAAAEHDTYIWGVSSIAHRLRDLLDPDALFVLVSLSGHVHLVCRSGTDAIDAGAIARVFGGGGHERAAAATVKTVGYQEALDRLWAQIEASIQPGVTVADLMSRGVQTVAADEPLAQVIRQLRRIGHEGYPVVAGERVVGLLTRRDADRAIEHDLAHMPVREVMIEGEVTLQPTDSISLLEQRMVETGWGQIPVIDDDRRPIGIVTRTDLIKHWATIHPETRQPTAPSITTEQIETVLGEALASLVGIISEAAQDAGLSLYMVGGVVRDLLLERRNLDVDFVVEGDAIAFAETLVARFGGRIHRHPPFGTAKWLIEPATAAALGLAFAPLPDHIDFATARNEFYEHPTALPTVYHSSIKLDLGRRDFTINTLAVQFSPAIGRILDFFGGLGDLDNGVLRVLHSLSFIDDPTRILRAVRFEQRLNFTIEARTAALMQTARPMLRRITGERVRNELTLLLREREPERGLLALHERGLLAAIHPAFTLDARLPEHLGRAQRVETYPWPLDQPDRDDLYWHLVLGTLPPHDAADLCERLLFGRHQTESITATAELIERAGWLADPAVRPSQIDARLRDLPELALYAAWLLLDDATARDRIVQYMTAWRHVRPQTDGHTLRRMGLAPGPQYSRILNRLRAAYLDGEVRDSAGEQNLLQSLLEERGDGA